MRGGGEEDSLARFQIYVVSILGDEMKDNLEISVHTQTNECLLLLDYGVPKRGAIYTSF